LAWKERADLLQGMYDATVQAVGLQGNTIALLRAVAIAAPSLTMLVGLGIGFAAGLLLR
jgi:hypothetical protein